jgi:Zn-dependent protease with chaperone function
MPVIAAILAGDEGLEDALVLALAAIGLAIVLRAARSLATHAIAARRFQHAVAGAPVMGTAAVRMRGERPVAFCAGLMTPRVYVSEGAVSTLERDELHAVLAHEEHHRRRRDPLRLLAVGCLADALFFLSAIARLRDRLHDARRAPGRRRRGRSMRWQSRTAGQRDVNLPRDR